MGPRVPLHHELVRPGDERQVVCVVELLGDVLAEGEPGASGADTPSAAVVRVGPEEVAHGSLVGHLLDPVELPDLVDGLDHGREAAVEAEDLVLDERCDGEVVEEVGEHLPDVGAAVLAKTLVVEAVDLGDLAGLVVAPEYCDSAWVPDLHGDEVRHCLY